MDYGILRMVPSDPQRKNTPIALWKRPELRRGPDSAPKCFFCLRSKYLCPMSPSPYHGPVPRTWADACNMGPGTRALAQKRARVPGPLRSFWVRARVPGPMRQRPGRGYFFKLSLKTDILFKLVWKLTLFSNYFEYIPNRVFKLVHNHGFQNFKIS